MASLKEVLAGYDKISDVGDEISDEEVAEVRNPSKDLARRQKKFFNDIGILNKDGKSYHLTEQGQKLGKFIRFNQDSDAKPVLQNLLLDWEPTDEILSYIDSSGIEEDELRNKIGFVTSTELSTRRKKTGAEAIVDLLEWTEIIAQNDQGTYEKSEENLKDNRDNELENDENSGKSTEKSVTVDGGQSQNHVLISDGSSESEGLHINLDISGDDDPENVRKLLLAIRKGTQQNLEEPESTVSK